MSEERPFTHPPTDLHRFLLLVDTGLHDPTVLIRSLRDASAGAMNIRIATVDIITRFTKRLGFGPLAEDVHEIWDDGEPGVPLTELARFQIDKHRDIATDCRLDDTNSHPEVLAETIRHFEDLAESMEAWLEAPRDDFLAEVTREWEEDQGSTVDAVVRRVNRTHFTVTKDGGYAAGREQTNPSLGHREVVFFAESAIKKDLDRRTVEVPDGKGGSKATGVGTAWCAHPQRRHYRHVTFDPDPLFHEGDGDERTLNLFRGFAVEPCPVADWSAFERLLRDVICGGYDDRYDYLTRWAAQMVQRPHEAAGTVLAMPGPKGAGKGTLGRALTGLVAPHGVQIAQPDQLTGKFNSHLASAVCLFVDEAFFSGDRRAENVLKSLITEPTFVCEPKGVDAFQVRNRLHIVMATNNDWVAPTDLGDRRYAVFSPEQEAVDRFKREVGFGRILKGQGQVRREVLAGWMQRLVRTDVDGWRADQDIPDTEALRRQRLITARRDVLLGWWERVLSRGGAAHARVPGWPDGPGEVAPVMKDELERDLTAHVAALPYRERVPDKTVVGQWLKARFGYPLDANIGAGRKRRRGWLLPPLEEARRDFERLVGSGEVEWEAFEPSEFDC
jgi:hypothetical protein